MEEHRLPVLKTLKSALKDMAGIIMKMPVLCMTVMLVFLIIKIYKPSRDTFKTEGFTIWNISEAYFYFVLIVAVRAIFALPAYRFLIDGEDRMQRSFRESIEAALAYCAAYVIFKILPIFALVILVSPMAITNNLSFIFFLRGCYDYCCAFLCILVHKVEPDLTGNRGRLAGSESELDKLAH